MKQISILELRKNVYAATKELPVEVTAKGETLFYIVKDLPIEEIDDPPEIIGLGTTKAVKSTEPIFDELWEDSDYLPVKKERIVNGYCDLWCKPQVKQNVYKVIRRDGYDRIVWTKKLCKDCVQKEYSTIKEHGGRLE